MVLVIIAQIAGRSQFSVSIQNFSWAGRWAKDSSIGFFSLATAYWKEVIRYSLVSSTLNRHKHVCGFRWMGKFLKHS